jgi:hypothetical protein
VLPHAAHAREVVLELCQLDLQLPLRGDRVLGEDVQDQLGPVDDAGGQRILERPLLCRLQLLVDDQHLCTRARVFVLQLGELALADVGPRIGARAVLHDLADGRDAGCPRQLPQLRQLVFVVGAVREHGEQQPALGLRLERALGIGHRHGGKYAPPPSAGRLGRREHLADRLARRTLELVDVPSESRREAAIRERVRALVARAVRASVRR